MIAFTSDIDWAPEEVIQDMLDLFEQFQVKCTLFCTHQSQVIQQCNRNLFEIGIHPNFNPLLDGHGKVNADQVIRDLKSIYPESEGLRSHSLTQSSRLLIQFKKHGFTYESNQLMPYHKGLKPFKLTYADNLWRIPYNWEDDVHWLSGKSFENPDIDLSGDDLKVFNFHPVHVFLNTDCQGTYENAKQNYQDASKARAFRNETVLGTRDLLVSLLKQVAEQRLNGLKLIEIVSQENEKANLS